MILIYILSSLQTLGGTYILIIMSNNIDNDQEGVVNDDTDASAVSEAMGDAQLAVSKSFQIMTYHLHVILHTDTIY